MFNIVRLGLGCILLLCIIFVSLKTRLLQKRSKLFTVIILFITLLSASYLVPFENVLFSFPSPESAFGYYNGDKYSIEFVVKGINSDLVIGDNNGTYTSQIIPKKKEMWKLPSPLSQESVYIDMLEGASIEILFYKDTEEYYISVLDMNGLHSSISDSIGTTFFDMEVINNLFDEGYVMHYGYRQNIPNDYSLYIDGHNYQITIA